MTVIGHLPAGTYKKGCITACIKKNRNICLSFNYTHLAIYDPEKYNKAFKTPHGQPVYHSGHVRTVEHKNAVKEMKGNSSINQLKAHYVITVDEDIENDFCDSEGFKGFQIYKVGPKANPQIFVHMELMCKRDGHEDAQPKGGYENFCSSGSDSD